MKKSFVFCLLFLLVMSIQTLEQNVHDEFLDHCDEESLNLLEDNLSYKYHLSKAKILLEQIEIEIQKEKKDSNVDGVNRLLSQKYITESQIELLQAAIDAAEKEESESVYFRYIIFGFLGVFFIALFSLLGYALVLKYQLKDSQKLQESFLQILEKASFIQEEAIIESEMGDIEVESTLNLKVFKNELAKLKKKRLDDVEFMDLKNLSIQCEMIGRRVDKATGRKNNAKNVADLVFKLSHELACSSYEALLYYCASLVFDVGFLYINQKIFTKAEINEKEKKEIRSHVDRGKEELVFIPEKYRPVFEIAVSLHHENNDGSGYPNGLIKKDIPLLARMIRVAETYTALVTRRNYRGIFDRDSAFLELKKESAKYDKDVLSALYRIL